MPLPREVLDTIAEDIESAESQMAALKDVVDDMRLAGMDVSKQEDRMDSLTDDLRKLKLFYKRQSAKVG